MTEVKHTPLPWKALKFERMCSGQYRCDGWNIRRDHRTGGWEIMRDFGMAKMPSDFTAKKFHRRLDDAIREINQYEFNRSRKAGD